MQTRLVNYPHNLAMRELALGQHLMMCSQAEGREAWTWPISFSQLSFSAQSSDLAFATIPLLSEFPKERRGPLRGSPEAGDGEGELCSQSHLGCLSRLWDTEQEMKHRLLRECSYRFGYSSAKIPLQLWLCRTSPPPQESCHRWEMGV